LPCSCSQNLSSFWFILKQQWTIKISSPLFSIFSLTAILVGSRDHRTHFGRGPSKDHSTKVWLQLAQWFLKRRLKCEMLTDGRRTKSDDNSSPGLKATWAKNQPIKNKRRLWRPCSLTDQEEMSDLYGGPSIDGSYQVSVHLVEGFLKAYLSVIQFRDNCILNRYKMYLYLN
jgi:hypothetical protein